MVDEPKKEDPAKADPAKQDPAVKPIELEIDASKLTEGIKTAVSEAVKTTVPEVVKEIIKALPTSTTPGVVVTNDSTLTPKEQTHGVVEDMLENREPMKEYLKRLLNEDFDRGGEFTSGPAREPNPDTPGLRDKKVKRIRQT